MYILQNEQLHDCIRAIPLTIENFQFILIFCYIYFNYRNI